MPDVEVCSFVHAGRRCGLREGHEGTHATWCWFCRSHWSWMCQQGHERDTPCLRERVEKVDA